VSFVAGAELDAVGRALARRWGFVAAPRRSLAQKSTAMMGGVGIWLAVMRHLFGVGAAHQAGLVVVGAASFCSLSV